MIPKINLFIYKMHIKRIAILLCFLIVSFSASSQEVKVLTLDEAIKLGIENSKALKLSQARIDQAISQYNQVKDSALPTGSMSYVYNHAEIPTSTFKLEKDSEPFHLPSRAEAFIGTFSLQQVIFAGNKLKYAKQSTDLLTKISQLDAEKDREEVIYNIIDAYFNLYKLQQSKNVVKQNLQTVDSQIKQSQRFFDQGIVTKNDVLRFQLQRSNIELTDGDLETNRKIVVYNLDVLLGLPENTDLNVPEIAMGNQQSSSNTAFIDTALNNRQEIKALSLQSQVAETNIKSLGSEILPKVLLGADVYYINPSGKFIPPSNMFIAPITVGATVAWNFDKLWTNKNKIAEAKIQKNQVEINKSLFTDHIKTEVNQNYQNYVNALNKISIIQAAIVQAQENNKILESKYNNNVASVTDKIDADTQLYQSLINIELAKADAGLAYYNLLKSTGTITTK